MVIFISFSNQQPHLYPSFKLLFNFFFHKDQKINGIFLEIGMIDAAWMQANLLNIMYI
jgi:hypothetical protein